MTTTEIDPRTQAALDAYHAGDPDSPPTVQLRSAFRDIGCSGSGPEFFRRVRYPGSDAPEGEWPDGDRLPRLGMRAAERRATAYCEVPVGTIVCEYSRNRFKGRGGRCSVAFFLVRPTDDEGKRSLLSLQHRTLRSRPMYLIALPDGTEIDWARRDHTER